MKNVPNFPYLPSSNSYYTVQQSASKPRYGTKTKYRLKDEPTNE
jgi:hypothetical protein